MSATTARLCCCPDCQNFVSDDHSNRERGKFTSNAKGLPLSLTSIFHRRDTVYPNYLSGYENSTLESIREWETAKGKRALLCAVTYNKQKCKLKGTNYDVIRMRDLLISQFRFPSSSIRILAEMDSCPHPTKRNIQEALKWLVKDNQHGDSLVFYFSGHGLRLADVLDDEIDGFDGTICPLDFRTAGMIVDNEINAPLLDLSRRVSNFMPLLMHFYSGEILDLPRVYNEKKNTWVDNSPPSGVYKGTSGGHAISISACGDDQLAAHTSAFSESGRQMEGAMTHTFRKAVENTNTRVLTYAGLLASMHRDILAAKKKCLGLRGLFHRERLQVPLLSSSGEFNAHNHLKT